MRETLDYADGLNLSLDDRICTIVINRPERANALDRATRSGLAQAIAEAGEDDEVRTIIITGAGDKAFCAGADIKAALASGSDEIRRNPLERSIYEAILDVPKPVIAAVNGVAAGGGCELALACDLRIVDERATFVLPEARRGMGAQFALAMLPRLIPAGIAAEMLLVGAPMTAAEARSWGLANRVTAPGGSLAAALELAHAIVANAPLSLRRIKAHLRKGQGLPLSAALQLDEGPSPYDSEDRIEGFRAFAEKRPPVWKGR